MKLRELAHARTGDNGDVSNIAVIGYRDEDDSRLRAAVTADRVRAHSADVVRGDVRRYELPGLGALDFVMDGALGGGVTRSLALDQHGKSLSSSLLDMDLGDDPARPSGQGGGHRSRRVPGGRAGQASPMPRRSRVSARLVRGPLHARLACRRESGAPRRKAPKQQKQRLEIPKPC